jgi:hypothetical protein
MAASLKSMIIKNLKSLSTLSPEDLVARRYEKFRRIGDFEEQVIEPTATATIHSRRQRSWFGAPRLPPSVELESADRQPRFLTRSAKK